MTHRYLSTDYGIECYACGIVLDYMSPDDPAGPYQSAPDSAHDALEDVARGLAFGLPCPSTGDARAHHYVLEGIPPAYADRGEYALQCAYDAARVDALTVSATVDPACTGG